jgi:glycosyltransferase involved in cell wall biosynthesis
MPQNDFAKLLAKSHLLLFPSIYEGCPHLVIEALSSGLPVVCFNVPGPREIIEGSLCGAVIKPFELHNMVSEILRFYNLWKNSEDEYNEISRRCRSYALNFDWNIIANHFDKMFEAVVEERRR